MNLILDQTFNLHTSFFFKNCKERNKKQQLERTLRKLSKIAKEFLAQMFYCVMHPIIP